MERKKIVKIRWYKKIWYAFTFPLFDIIGRISLIIALFTKVEWKAIPHTDSASIKDIEHQMESTGQGENIRQG